MCYISINTECTYFTPILYSDNCSHHKNMYFNFLLHNNDSRDIN